MRAFSGTVLAIAAITGLAASQPQTSAIDQTPIEQVQGTGKLVLPPVGCFACAGGLIAAAATGGAAVTAILDAPQLAVGCVIVCLPGLPIE